MTEPPEMSAEQIEKVRRDVAKAYHDLMIDLAMKGEGQVGGRRFWRNEEDQIEWEDLPDDGGQVREVGILPPSGGSEDSGGDKVRRVPGRVSRRTRPVLGIVRADVTTGDAG